LGVSAGLARGALGIHGCKALLSQLFGDVQVKTEELAAIRAHMNILTVVEVLFSRFPSQVAELAAGSRRDAV